MDGLAGVVGADVSAASRGARSRRRTGERRGEHTAMRSLGGERAAERRLAVAARADAITATGRRIAQRRSVELIAPPDRNR